MHNIEFVLLTSLNFPACFMQLFSLAYHLTLTMDETYVSEISDCVHWTTTHRLRGVN